MTFKLQLWKKGKQTRHPYSRPKLGDGNRDNFHVSEEEASRGDRERTANPLGFPFSLPTTATPGLVSFPIGKDNGKFPSIRGHDKDDGGDGDDDDDDEH